MLWAAGFKRPDRMPVHGHLTVNGEKMSKSRGTFVTGRTYLDSGLDPELLRYFYAANLGPGVQDLDLALDEFRNRVNADLANNVANLASRVAALVGRAGSPLSETPEPPLVEVTRAALSLARGAYDALEYREVVRLANQVADRCNKRLQEAKPWEDPASPSSRTLLFSCAKALRAIATILWPIMPRFSDGLAAAFGQERPAIWDAAFDAFAGAPVAVAVKPPQIARLDPKQVEKLILEAGDPEPRTIVAGIAQAYPDPAALVGKRIVVVANLAPRPLRGITSQGMLLAAGEAPNLSVVTVADSIAPGTRVK
jgi:methionyl-tRNA synthetase